MSERLQQSHSFRVSPGMVEDDRLTRRFGQETMITSLTVRIRANHDGRREFSLACERWGIVAREVQRYGDDSRKKKYKGVPQSIAYHVRGPNEALRALCALWFVEHVEYADRDIFSAPGSGEAKQRKNNGYTPCLPITAMAK